MIGPDQSSKMINDMVASNNVVSALTSEVMKDPLDLATQQAFVAAITASNRVAETGARLVSEDVQHTTKLCDSF